MELKTSMHLTSSISMNVLILGKNSIILVGSGPIADMLGCEKVREHAFGYRKRVANSKGKAT